MNNKYWWVNHKKTFKQEISGGYIWSPKKNKNNARNKTYENLEIKNFKIELNLETSQKKLQKLTKSFK